jgi:23S rRNA G2069 N7-methylase RlmK/C1962 C5-methylase RlmI
MFKVTKRPLRILDFDSECRPMHYSEWKPESQITAIAWSWVGEDKVHTEALNRNLRNENKMLARFLAAYDEADIVTGHYIRKHDLPLVNDHVLRAFGEHLSPKLTQDTMSDMTSVKSLGKSQDNLAVTFGLTEEKHHMTGADWRLANSLDPKGIDLARIRVTNDVIQHKALREEMLRRGALGEPQLWIP